MPDAREKGRWFRREYNTVRPHSSLDYATPKEFGAAAVVSHETLARLGPEDDLEDVEKIINHTPQKFYTADLAPLKKYLWFKGNS